MRSPIAHVVAAVNVTALPTILVLAIVASTAPPSLAAPPTPASGIGTRQDGAPR